MAALLALAGSGALMTMIMAVGPLGSQHAGHSESLGAAIIQWHLVGMFAPAVVSGAVLSRIGPWWTSAIGTALFLVGSLVGLAGEAFVNFLVGLALNGVGWNFLYLAGTAFLVRCYPPGRGGRIQAVAEGLTSLSSVAASVSASTVFLLLGWRGTNGPVLVVSALLLVVLAVMAASGRRAAPAAERPAEAVR